MSRKLTPEEVEEIRYKYAENDDVTQAELADEYQTTRSNISDIVLGNNWPDAGGPITEKHSDGPWRPRAKVSEQQVIEIREKRAAGVSTYQLEEEYPINRRTIGEITKGRSWTEVGGPIEGDDYEL